MKSAVLASSAFSALEFGLVDLTPGTVASIIAVPVAAFEIILLRFWLFYRGFKMPEATETAASG